MALNLSIILTLRQIVKFPTQPHASSRIKHRWNDFISLKSCHTCSRVINLSVSVNHFTCLVWGQWRAMLSKTCINKISHQATFSSDQFKYLAGHKQSGHTSLPICLVRKFIYSISTLQHYFLNGSWCMQQQIHH